MTRESTAPFSKADEAFYGRLIEQTGYPYTARETWRILHSRYVGPRAECMAGSIWLVPSTRTGGNSYRVNLNTRECELMGPDGELKPCPDKTYNRKAECCHFVAAREARRNHLAHNTRNMLIFPGDGKRLRPLESNSAPRRGWELDPPQRAAS